MREVAFIQKNKAKWTEVEEVIGKKKEVNPDELSTLYISLINDLSFAQTYYPKSKVTIYLNHLSATIYQQIYKTKRAEQNRLISFFVTEVPLIMYRHRKTLWFAFALFALFTAIGVVSSIYDDSFVRLILGDYYVDMTIDNIASGNPIEVYDGDTMWAMAWTIIRNNIMVGAYMFVYGIFAGIGTLYILLRNAIMLGSFQYMFYEHGALADSMRGIWVHGAFEISGMVVEAAAGFILATSWLFPKTYSRFQSFKIGFKESFKIYLSTIPFTIAAGILEGYVTRFALEIPLSLNLFIILGTLGFIIFYYAVYPLMVWKKEQQRVMLQFQAELES